MPPRRALRASLALFDDRIELRTFGWSGRRVETFQLGDIKAVEWWSKDSTEGEVNFSLDLGESGSLPLHMKKGAGLWYAEIVSLRPALRKAGSHPQTQRGSRSGSRRDFSVAA
jgi:hypothetical protein